MEMSLLKKCPFLSISYVYKPHQDFTLPEMLPISMQFYYDWSKSGEEDHEMAFLHVDLEHSCANISFWMNSPLAAFSWLARPMPACLLQQGCDYSSDCCFTRRLLIFLFFGFLKFDVVFLSLQRLRLVN